MEQKQSKVFQDLDIFENKCLNEYCDRIYGALLQNFGNTSGIILGGSVAKVLDGLTGYEPKDIDFIVKDYYAYRFLQANIKMLFPNFNIVEDDMRIIIFTGINLIEVWKGGVVYATQEKLYKEKIRYIV